MLPRFTIFRSQLSYSTTRADGSVLVRRYFGIFDTQTKGGEFLVRSFTEAEHEAERLNAAAAGGRYPCRRCGWPMDAGSEYTTHESCGRDVEAIAAGELGAAK